MARAIGPYDRVIRLRDGRHLGYAEFGDPRGRPIIHCHGGLSSRLDISAGHQSAAELSVRIIAPDRPGVGLSDRKPGRGLLDWPDDVAELADSLEIEKFAVMGWSLGGQYCAATAFALPERVTIAGLVASAIPREWPGMIEQINAMDRRFMRMSRNRAGLFAERAAFAGMRAAARGFPKLMLKEALGSERGGPTVTQFRDATREGLLQPAGVSEEYAVLDSPWGFDPASIGIPVILFQGTGDEFVPEDWAHQLRIRIPGAKLRIYPGEGHFLMYQNFTDIFSGLTGQSLSA